MGRKFSDIFITTLLIVIVLIPMVVLLGALIAYDLNPLFWVVVGIAGMAGISYLQYIRENPKCHTNT